MTATCFPNSSSSSSTTLCCWRTLSSNAFKLFMMDLFTSSLVVGPFACCGGCCWSSDLQVKGGETKKEFGIEATPAAVVRADDPHLAVIRPRLARCLVTGCGVVLSSTLEVGDPTSASPLDKHTCDKEERYLSVTKVNCTLI